jgi:hypothetical protein
MGYFLIEDKARRARFFIVGSFKFLHHSNNFQSAGHRVREHLTDRITIEIFIFYGFADEYRLDGFSQVTLIKPSPEFDSSAQNRSFSLNVSC